MPKSRVISITNTAALIAAGAILTACGGGGGGSTATPPTSVSPPTPPTSQGPTWTQGVFEPASTFKDQCAAPRSGVDIEGNSFPDQQGTLLEELFWLRSWTDETYLWNDEVTDRDPAGFSDRLSYFAVLKTDAVEASGEDRDDFHFSQSTEAFLAARNSVGNPGFGASLAVLQGSRPRDIRVAYTEPNSPASRPVGGVVPFPRGTRILEIDGADVVNGFTTQAEIDQLNTILFSPASIGETYAFRVQDTDGTIRTVNLTTEDISRKPVLTTSVINTATGNVGYIMFNTFSPFSSEEEIILAMQTMQSAGVSDLVLDMRYNGGGLLAVASQVAYMIAGPSRTSGAAFEQLVFNAGAGNVNPVTGARNDPIPFYNEVLGFDSGSSLSTGASLPALNLNRVFILSTGRTCSASEAVINGLRGVDVEVVLIGNTTCGKPYGFYPQDNCGETYYTIQFQGTNNKGFGAYADGFIPSNSTANFGVRISGCQVGDDLNNPLGSTAEGLLAAALNYRTSNSCPAVSSKTVSTFVGNKIADPLELSPEAEAREFFLRNNRDMSMPE